MTPEQIENVRDLLQKYHPTVVATMTGLTLEEVRSVPKKSSTPKRGVAAPSAAARPDPSFTEDMHAEMRSMYESRTHRMCETFAKKHQIPVAKVRQYAQQCGWALQRPPRDADNARTSWAKTELQSLVKMRDELKLSWVEIGARMGRTENSIRFKYARIARAGIEAVLGDDTDQSTQEDSDSGNDEEVPLSSVTNAHATQAPPAVAAPATHLHTPQIEMASVSEEFLEGRPRFTESQEQWLVQTAAIIVRTAQQAKQEDRVSAFDLVAAAAKHRVHMSAESVAARARLPGWTSPFSYAESVRLMWWFLAVDPHAQQSLARQTAEARHIVVEIGSQPETLERYSVSRDQPQPQ